MKNLLLVLGVLGFSVPGLAARGEAGAPCRAIPASGLTKISECPQSGKVLVRLAVPRGRGVLEVYALFPHGGPGMFERFWTAADSPQKFRAGEQGAIRSLGKQLRAHAGPALSLTKFLGTFAGPDFVLKEYRIQPKPRSPVTDFKMICSRIGHYQKAEFTAFGEDVTARALVGSGPCLGRCGAGCGDEKPGEGVYTQQCLNHDVCSYATNENMGECEDEFWDAADGYMNAPDCASLRGES